MSGSSLAKRKSGGTAPAKMPRPDPRDEFFIVEYMIDFNAERAAVAAKFAPTTARTIAFMWVKPDGPKPHVYAEIQRRRALIVEKAETKAGITAEQIVDEWKKICSVNFFDLLSYDKAGAIKVDNKGLPVLDFTKLTRDHMAAVAEIGDGKIKFYGKDGVLRDLARHLGMFAKDAPKIDIHMTLEQLIQQSYADNSAEKEKA